MALKHHSPSETTVAVEATCRDEDADLLAGVRLLAEAGDDRLSVRGGLHRRHDRDFVLRAASGLAAGAFAPEKRIVDLDPAVELTGAARARAWPP